MADSAHWQDVEVEVGELRVLVQRIKWAKRGWEIEAWVPAPPGEGSYLYEGHWYVRPFERTAKRAIYTAFPKARGEWTGNALRESKSLT